MELAGKRVYLAGHAGMVGSAVHRRLASEDCEVLTTTRSDVDLRNQAAVQAWMADAKPDAVIVAAAKVGGILANDTQPADFLYDNLMIEANLIHAAYEAKVEKLLFLGSSCIYPKHAEQPMREDALLTGPLEPTNEWYAIAKIAGIKMCQAYRKQYGCDFISAMPTNMYGFNDNFDLQSSHVLPALIVKVHNAKLNGDKSYEVWGSGAPLREFMYADDCADALVHLLKNYSGQSHVNVGTGEEVSIRQLAETICEVIGFDGNLVFDASKPDGTPRKLMDSSLLRGMGWSPKVQLKQGIARTYQWYLDNADQLRG
jgi:GDP-L-fucose synthase